jgi:hypothetical protein
MGKKSVSTSTTVGNGIELVDQKAYAACGLPDAAGYTWLTLVGAEGKLA